jgi:hypothetical protein
MTGVTIEGDNLKVRMDGLDTFLAVRHEMTVPLASIVRAEEMRDPEKQSHQGWKEWGGYWPGKFRNGTFREGGKHVFWNVRDLKTARAVTIHLDDRFYDHLVLEVDDPAAVVAMIEQAKRAVSGR